MKKIKLLMMSIAFAGFTGCAHSVMRGSVAMKISANEAHVCLGKGEIEAGDRVRLFRNVCTGKGVGDRDIGRGSCEKKEIGMGSVQEVLNSHYSIVKFDQGVQFEEGTFVEKK